MVSNVMSIADNFPFQAEPLNTRLPRPPPLDTEITIDDNQQLFGLTYQANRIF